MPRPAVQPKLRLPHTFSNCIVRQPINWLWKPWLQCRALNLLTGEPGIGKSTLTCELVAALTTGRALPGDDARPPVNCWILNSEDAAGDTIVPRLIAQGADLKRVLITDASTGLDAEATREMELTIHRNNIGLVSIDPLQGWMGGAVDMHRANETREWANHLRLVAINTGCAMMFVRHRRKGAAGDQNMNSGMGSIDITGFARCEIGARKDKQDQCYITRVKGNMGRPPMAIAYTVESCADAEEDVGVLHWGGPYLEATGPAVKSTPRKLKHAIEWLRDQLVCGPKPSGQVYKDARARGITSGSLNRAAKELRLVKDGDLWHLPPDDGPRSNATSASA